MDMTPTQWMIEPLRRYAQFSGRARRAEFWWFILFGLIVAIVASVLDYMLGTPRTGGASGTGLIGGLVSLGFVIPQTAVTVRRLHDINRTGWWIAAPVAFVVPMAVLAIGTVAGLGIGFGIAAVLFFVMVIVTLVWNCTRGTDGPNRFGPDPLATPPTD